MAPRRLPPGHADHSTAAGALGGPGAGEPGDVLPAASSGTAISPVAASTPTPGSNAPYAPRSTNRQGIRSTAAAHDLPGAEIRQDRRQGHQPLRDEVPKVFEIES